jgi:hypothetical protein
MTVQLGVESPADARLCDRVEHWIAKSVDCVVGRREMSKSRYCVAVIGSPQEFAAANREFQCLAEAGSATGCFYVARDQQRVSALPDVASATDFLRTEMLSGFREIASGESVSQSFSLTCPVTGVVTAFPDFDLVGFYPQAGRTDDPLYDPSNFAPFVGINQASDLFGFARFTADLAVANGRAAPGAFRCPQFREEMFARAGRVWQEMARRTIESIGAKTDRTRLCPAHISGDGHFYVTPHNESAFGEGEKLEHFSEMPILYLERLLDEWRDFFAAGAPPRLKHVTRPALCPAIARNPLRHRPPREPPERLLAAE